MKVAFRTDASLTIGTGHVQRCLALATELRRRGAEAAFVCRELAGHQMDLIALCGFAVHRLPRGGAGGAGNGTPHAAWLPEHWRIDAEQTRAAIGDGWDWLVVDHYALDTSWQQALRPATRRVLAIDDVADRPHDCDLLLDQNLHPAADRRYTALAPPACIQLLGPKHALLRPEFARQRARLKPRRGQVRGLHVFFGGADSENATGRALDAIAALPEPGLVVDAMLGGANPHMDSLCAQAARDTRVRLHVESSEVAELMGRADLALGAAGVSTWERACMGLPTLIVSVADNQVEIARAVAAAGAAHYLGTLSAVNSTEIQAALRAALTDPDALVAMSAAAAALTDGEGAARVAVAMGLSV